MRAGLERLACCGGRGSCEEGLGFSGDLALEVVTVYSPSKAVPVRPNMQV
jgi:hypothetical protein